MTEVSESSAEAQSPESVARLKAQLRRDEKRLALVQEIGRALSAEMELDDLLKLIVEKITLLMDADRSTLYLFSDDGKELWSKVAQGDRMLEIRLKVGEGIAGWVAHSGETVNIPDAYNDQRFYPAVDLRSGYRTRSILCMPMNNNQGSIIGVVQVLNKQDGPFTNEDEHLLEALASQAAVAIENAKLYQRLQRRTNELNILFAIEEEMGRALDLDELLDRLLRRAMEVVSADAGSILLRERGSDELYFRSAAGPARDLVKRLRVKMSSGIVGWVASQRKPLIVNDPTGDVRHDKELADVIGVHPRNLVCVPLVADDETLGVIELLDKRGTGAAADEPASFDQRDLQVLQLIAGQASKAIQLARAKAERVNQSRLASIGQMLSGVLHDLKTPMTVVSGYAQLMAQIDEADERAQYVEHILKQFDLMSAMTREVLAFARGESNVLIRKVFLHRFLDEVAAQLKHEFQGRGVTLELDAQYRGVAYFDEQKMLRVIHNLSRNAGQAMQPQGGGRFRIGCRAEAPDLVLEFADTGPGIPAEMEGRLFELFASSGKKDGTGLGLAIVKKIVDDHKGTISVTSRRGEGTTFTLRLPLERPKSTGPAAAVEPAAD